MICLSILLISVPAQAGWWRRGSDKEAGRRVEPISADIARAKTEFIPMPDLAGMIAERQGIKRPERLPLRPLPDLGDADSLPREALGMIVERMGNHANWQAVAYGASGHRDPMDKVRAEWAKRDALANVNEYLGKLSAAQRRIADFAFKAGLAEHPNFDGSLPERVTLDWLTKNFRER